MKEELKSVLAISLVRYVMMNGTGSMLPLSAIS